MIPSIAVPRPSLDQFRAVLHQIVRERPDFIYNPASSPVNIRLRCEYIPTTRPDGTISRCLIGETLYRLGVTDEQLAKNNTPGENGLVLVYVNLGWQAIDDGLLKYARRVQQKQDSGYTWGEALAWAESHINGS